MRSNKGPIAPVSKPALALNRFSLSAPHSVSRHCSTFIVHVIFVVGARWLMTSVLATRFSNLSGTSTNPFFFSFRILEVSPNVAVRGSW